VRFNLTSVTSTPFCRLSRAVLLDDKVTLSSPIRVGPGYFNSFISPGNPHMIFKLVGASLY
jgi:hypothetical protein